MTSTPGKTEGEEKKMVEREEAKIYPGIMNTGFTKSAMLPPPATPSLVQWPLLLCPFPSPP